MKSIIILVLLSATFLPNIVFPISQLAASNFSENDANDTLNQINQTNSSSGVISSFNNMTEQTAVCADVHKSICFNEVHRSANIVI